MKLNTLMVKFYFFNTFFIDAINSLPPFFKISCVQLNPSFFHWEIATFLSITKFPNLTVPAKGDICYATTNRQYAMKDLAPRCDLVLVVGAQNSSNSQRLREVAEDCGTRAHLIDDARNIRDAWFDQSVETVGVSAGASAPEVLVEGVVEDLKKRGATHVELLDIIPEDVFFPLPKELKLLPMAITV